MFRFAYPQLLFFIFIIVGGGIFKYRKKPVTLIFSGASALGNLTGQVPALIVKLPIILRVLALVLMVAAISRPQKYNISSITKSSGLDIILSIDTSGSMKALDFMENGKNITRLQAVKSVVNDFIRKREHDRIGLVVFGEKAYTQCPLTLDKGLLLKLIDNMEIGMAGDSTAIGLATALGAKRLENLKAETKILILLTDGRNNAGDIDPLQASEAASALGIKIYSIGVGGFGPAPFVVNTVFGKRIKNFDVDLDEDTLKKIAQNGGGQYFRASDTDELKKIYAIIDKLETTEINVKNFFNYQELYRFFLIPAFIILFFEILFKSLIIRRIP